MVVVSSQVLHGYILWKFLMPSHHSASSSRQPDGEVRSSERPTASASSESPPPSGDLGGSFADRSARNDPIDGYLRLYGISREQEKKGPGPGVDPEEPHRPASQVGDRSLGRTHAALAFAAASAGAFGVAAVGGSGLVAVGAAMAGFCGAMKVMLASTPDRVKKSDSDAFVSNEYAKGAGGISLPMMLMLGMGYESFGTLGVPLLGAQIAVGAVCAALHFVRPTPTAAALKRDDPSGRPPPPPTSEH